MDKQTQNENEIEIIYSCISQFANIKSEKIKLIPPSYDYDYYFRVFCVVFYEYIIYTEEEINAAIQLTKDTLNKIDFSILATNGTMKTSFINNFNAIMICNDTSFNIQSYLDKMLKPLERQNVNQNISQNYWQSKNSLPSTVKTMAGSGNKNVNKITNSNNKPTKKRT